MKIRGAAHRMNASADSTNDFTSTADDFATARAALLERFEHCAAHLNHTTPHSSSVDTSDPNALTLRVGRRAFFTFHRTPDGPAYAWWYPASRAPGGRPPHRGRSRARGTDRACGLHAPRQKRTRLK